MFWKHFTPPVSELDNLLNNDDCTLTEVLDAEDVLQECKGINNKLLKFLTRQDNIEELISLVTSEPLDDVDEAERFKHPNTACNILTSGAGPIAEKLMSEEPLLDKLFEFMTCEPPLNSLLASFFSRVVIELFSRKASRMLEYVSSKDGLVDSLLSHIDTSAIMDLLLGIVSSFQMPEERQEVSKWMADSEMVNKLVDLIRGDVASEKQRNAARALTELHRHGYEYLSMNYDSVTQDELVESLESPEVIQRLLENVLAHRDSPGPFCHGPEIICSMVVLQQVGTQTNGIIAESVQYPNVTNEDAARRMAGCLIPFLKPFVETLHDPPKAEPMRTSIGEIKVPLGPARLAIVHLLTTLTQVGCTEYDSELARLDLASIMLDLFEEFQWNNFLHTYVDQFATFVLGSSSEASGDLVKSLINKGNLLQRLAEIAMDNEHGQLAKNARRRGYMGHVVNISNNLLQCLDSNDRLKAAVEAVDSDDLDQWRQWVDGPLETVNKKNNKVLGGNLPSLMSLESSDEDPIETTQHAPQVSDAFTFYQTQQMASDFADSFGFDEEDFPELDESENAQFEEGSNIDFGTPTMPDATSASLFEQACSERLRRYSDDDDSDQDESSNNFSHDWPEREIIFPQEGVDSDSSSGSDSRSHPCAAGMEHSSSTDEDDIDGDDEDDDITTTQAPSVIKSRPTAAAGDAAAAGNQIESGDDLFVTENTDWTANFDSMEMDTSASPNIWGLDEESASASATGTATSSAATGAASSSTSNLTSWADFGAFPEQSTSDETPLVASTTDGSVGVATTAEGTPSASTCDERMGERSSSSGEVSSTDDSDSSDERDGSYSFGNVSSGSDGDTTSPPADENASAGSRDGDHANAYTALESREEEESGADTPTPAAETGDPDEEKTPSVTPVNAESSGEASEVQMDTSAPSVSPAPDASSGD